MRNHTLALAAAAAFFTGLLLTLSSLSDAPKRPGIQGLIAATMRETPTHFGLGGTIDAEIYKDVIVIPDIHGDSTHFIRCVWLGLKKVQGRDIKFSDLEESILAAAVHGEYPNVPLLPKSDTVLVQMGDLVDRGPDSVLCLRILWVIEKVVGWKVVSLLGNHELMSSIGIRPEYIHPKERSEFRSLAKRYAEFSPGRPLWDKLMRESLIAVKFSSRSILKNTLFVHAGIDPVYLEKRQYPSVDDINMFAISRLNGDVVQAGDEVAEWVANDSSPLWTRVFAHDSFGDDVLCDEILPPILEHLGVNRIVVGHNPQADHLMKSRCGSRVILTDCAVSRWLFMDQGQPGILVMRNGDAYSDDWSKLEAFYYDFASESVRSAPLN